LALKVFRLLLGVEVIEVPKKFIETMHRRQELIAVAQMVLAELARRIAERLERFGECDVFFLEANGGAWQADLRQSRAQRRLAGDERRPAGRATLLGIIIRDIAPSLAMRSMFGVL
jgi:hypothetical protein